MKKSGEAKLFIILALVLALGGGAMFGLKTLGEKTDIFNTDNRPTPTPLVLKWDAAKFDEAVKKARHVEGPDTAPVSIIEFADFQCPSCRRAYNDTLAPLMKSGKPFRLAFFHFPLVDMHQFAMSAAQATEGAAKQGKFWDLYRILFNDAKKELSEEYIEDCAKKAGVDMTKFKLDRAADTVKTDIQQDLEYGRTLGVNSTPTFIVKDASGKVNTFVGGKDLAAALKKTGML